MICAHWVVWLMFDIKFKYNADFEFCKLTSIFAMKHLPTCILFEISDQEKFTFHKLSKLRTSEKVMSTNPYFHKSCSLWLNLHYSFAIMASWIISYRFSISTLILGWPMYWHLDNKCADVTSNAVEHQKSHMPTTKVNQLVHKTINKVQIKTRLSVI